MLRCSGAAPDGAVLVGAGIENVWLPRLPIEAPAPELLAPARAKASPGASARETAAKPAIRNEVRRMGVLTIPLAEDRIWGRSGCNCRGAGAGQSGEESKARALPWTRQGAVAPWNPLLK